MKTDDSFTEKYIQAHKQREQSHPLINSSSIHHAITTSVTTLSHSTALSLFLSPSLITSLCPPSSHTHLFLIQHGRLFSGQRAIRTLPRLVPQAVAEVHLDHVESETALQVVAVSARACVWGGGGNVG